MINDLII